MGDVTDLEMTKLCAQAMGYESREWPHGAISCCEPGIAWYAYCPLADDAQAMALVKRFRLSIAGSVSRSWLVTSDFSAKQSADLNRAIVECCAHMQVRTEDEWVR